MEEDIHKQAQWSLPLPRDPAKNQFFLGKEQYYFLKRRDTGKRAKCTLDLGGDVDGATWKPNKKATPIVDEETSDTISYVTSLTLIFKNKGKGDWIMQEYMNDNKKNVQECWVLCQVKYIRRVIILGFCSTSITPDALFETLKSVVVSEDANLLLPLKRQRAVELDTGGLGDMEGSLVEGESVNDTKPYEDEIERMLEQSN